MRFEYKFDEDDQHEKLSLKRHQDDSLVSDRDVKSRPIPERLGVLDERFMSSFDTTGARSFGVDDKAPTGASRFKAFAGAVGSRIGSLFSGGKKRASGGGGQKEASSMLGEGAPLDGGVRSRMASAFGESFSDVRVHTDAQAASLASGVDARAFTVGNHIAFGAGAYRPGSLYGDAIIAHELAHTMQQSEGGMPGGMMGTGDSGVESDADGAAFGAMAAIHAPGLAPASRKPKRRLGLSLSRCATASKEQAPPTVADPQKMETAPETPEEAVETAEEAGAPEEVQRQVESAAEFCRAPDLAEIDALVQEKLAQCHALTAAGSPQVEYCGMVIRNVRTGELRATDPVTQNEQGQCGANATVTTEETVVAYYHSHPRGPSQFGRPGDCNADFSEAAKTCFPIVTGDKEEACNREIIYYLVNAEGQMKRFCANLNEDDFYSRPICQGTSRGRTDDIGRVP